MKMHNLSFPFLLFGLGLVWFILAGFPNNPPNGYTGAPGEATCSQCHTGNNPDGLDGTLRIEGLPEEITPNTTYSISIIVENPNGLGADAGFQWVALDEANNNAGEISNPSPSSTLALQNARIYHEHNPMVNFPENNEITWTANWTAPSTTSGTITIYAAAVVGNGGDGSGRDLVVTEQVEGVLVSGAPFAIQSIEGINVNCFGGSDGQASVTAIGGTPPYQYSWSNGGSGSTIDNLPQGNYAVTVTDSDEVSESQSVVISQPEAISAGVTSTQESDLGANDGTAMIMPEGGTPPFTINWSTGESGESINNLMPGTYEVSVTDQNGCSYEETFIINAFECPTINFSSQIQSEICPESTSGAIQIDNVTGITGTVLYQWNTGANTSNISNLTAGSYEVTISSSSTNCSLIESFEVTELDTIAPIIVCPENIVSSSCDGIVDYVLPTAEDNCTGIEITQLTGLESGSFFPPGVNQLEFEAEDLASNTATCTFTITQSATLIGNLITTNESNVGANDGAAIIQPQGGTSPYTVNWSNGAQGNSINNLSPGDYTVSIADQNGCTYVESFFINAFECPMITFSSDVQTEICTGSASGEIQINNVTGIAGTILYQWNTGETTSTVSNLPAGIYQLTISSASTICSISESFEITELDTIAPTILCPANIISTSCDGRVDYALPTAEDNCEVLSITKIAGPESGAIFPAGMTMLEFSAEDAAGNTSVCAFTINVPSILEANVNTQEVSCAGAADGSIELTIMGGTPPYTIPPEEQLTNLDAGNYPISISDANGCLWEETVLIEEPTAIIAELINLVNATNTNANGSIEVSISGGNAPYSIFWLEGDVIIGEAPFVDSLAAGTYTLTVLDDQGCTLFQSFTVDQITAIGEEDIALVVKVFPNPSTGILQVEIPTALVQERLTFTLISNNGQEIPLPKQESSIEGAILIDLSDFPSGIYFLRIHWKDGNLVQKLLKIEG